MPTNLSVREFDVEENFCYQMFLTTETRKEWMTLKDTSVSIWSSVTGTAKNTNHNLKDMTGSHESLY